MQNPSARDTGRLPYFAVARVDPDPVQLAYDLLALVVPAQTRDEPAPLDARAAARVEGEGAELREDGEDGAGGAVAGARVLVCADGAGRRGVVGEGEGVGEEEGAGGDDAQRAGVGGGGLGERGGGGAEAGHGRSWRTSSSAPSSSPSSPASAPAAKHLWRLFPSNRQAISTQAIHFLFRNGWRLKLDILGITVTLTDA